MGEREGCATGPYRTPTILGNTTRTWSKQFYLIHRNKHREAAQMRRQRDIDQMKVQIKTSEKELNKRNTSNLSDAEFKILAIRMPKELSEDVSSI